MIYKYIILIILLIIASIYDIKDGVVPGFLVTAGVLAGCVAALFGLWINITGALIGGIIVGGVLYFVSIVTGRGISLVDAKLTGCIGIFAGLLDALTILVITSVICGLAGLVTMIFFRRGKKRCLPFAPFLLTGTIVTMILNCLF